MEIAATQVSIGAASGTTAARLEVAGTSGNVLTLIGLPTYADNAAATTGGLAVGQVYRTSTGALMVRY